VDEAATHTLAQRLAAEGLGTFVLVLFGCGAAVMSDYDIVTTGLAFGLAYLAMLYAAGRVSGGHFNPAVSLGAAVSGRLPWVDVALYAASQLAGALLGGLMLFALLNGFDGFDSEGNMGQNGFGDDGTGYAVWAAFLLELLLTAVFVYVVLAVTDRRNEHAVMAPVAIGFTLSMIHFASIPATGTSVNPARSIGSGLFAGGDAILQLWLVILAPLAGAAFAGFAYPLVFGYDRERPVRAPRPVAAGAPQWDPQRQQWVGGTQEHGWEQPQQPWAQPDPNSQWQQPSQPSQPQQQPQQPRQPTQPPQQQPWQQPDPNAPRQPWEAEGEDGRTQIRPPEGPV
jgi:aquaporin Z